MRAPLSAALALALAPCGAPNARARAQAAPEALSPVLVLPVIAGRRADRELAQQFVRALKDEAGAHPEIEVATVRGGAPGARRLQRQTRRCKRRAACLAKLGRRAKARGVLATTGIQGDDGGLQVLAVVIDARSRQTLRQTSVTVTRDTFDSMVAESFVTLFGVEPPAEVEIELADAEEDPSATDSDPPLSPELALDSEAVTDAAEPEPSAPSPGTQEGATERAELDLGAPAVAPAEPAPASATAAPPAPGRAGPARNVAMEPGVSADGSERGLSSLAWAGLSTLTVGAVSAGLGAVWVTQAQGATEQNPDRSTQLAARDALDDAQAKMRNGNIALITAGVLSLTGLTLLFVDSLDDAPVMGVAPVDGGVAVRLSLPF